MPPRLFVSLSSSRWNSVGIRSQALFGVPTLLGAPWNGIDPLVIALPLSALVIVAVQALRVSARLPAPEAEPGP